MYKRIDVNHDENETGMFLIFGSYPQTRESDSYIQDQLNVIAGEFPTDVDDKK